MKILLKVFCGILILHTSVYGADLSLNFDQSGTVTAKIIQLLAALTILSLAPSIIMMVTSFTRIVVIFSFLRSALGLQQSPPNPVIISLSLFLTFFIMSPVLNESYQKGVAPLIDGKISEHQAFPLIIQPFKDFMIKHVKENDLALFASLENNEQNETNNEKITRTGISLTSLVPAFMISELRRAFEIGFLIYIPFIVIDMLIASILMAMGMMMLPPVVISLPFKIIFFVMIDGWYMICGSIIKGFGL